MSVTDVDNCGSYQWSLHSCAWAQDSICQSRNCDIPSSLFLEVHTHYAAQETDEAVCSSTSEGM